VTPSVEMLDGVLNCHVGSEDFFVSPGHLQIAVEATCLQEVILLVLKGNHQLCTGDAFILQDSDDDAAVLGLSLSGCVGIDLG